VGLLYEPSYGMMGHLPTDSRWGDLITARYLMQRVTKELLNTQINWLNGLSGGSYRVQYENGAARMQTQDGAENISQYGTKREISMILDAMIKISCYENASAKIGLAGLAAQLNNDSIELI